MKKLLFLLLAIELLIGCKKKDEVVDRYITYQINVTAYNVNERYSFYEPNNKLIMVKGNYMTVQTYKKGQTISIVIGTGDRSRAKVDILKTGNLIETYTFTSHKEIQFVAN